MRAVVQRVSRASVTVESDLVGSIGKGVVVLLGVGREDTAVDADYLAEKVVGLRIFEDDDGKMNRCLAEVGGGCLVVSQFTLLGDCRKGRRPSFVSAALPEQAEPLYQRFVVGVRERRIEVATGRFQTQMDVELVNDGPVTLLLDSGREF